MRLFFLSTLMCAVITASAQDETDAVLFGTAYHGFGSTARSIGLAGAVGSVGADFAAVSTNPATLARYSKDEISITTAYSSNRTVGEFSGNRSSQVANKFALSNIGFVSASRREGIRRNTRNKAFALGLNKLYQFNAQQSYSGKTTHSSIMDMFAQRINKSGGLTYLNNAGAYIEDVMAYNTYLVDDNPASPNQVKSYVPLTDLQQSRSIDASGSMQEIVLALAQNFNDRVHLGVTVGLPVVNYSSFTKYREEDMSGSTTNNFGYLDYLTRRESSGGGINLKAGISVMPRNSPLRLGFAAHSPTALSIDESYSFAMKTNLEGYQNIFEHSVGNVNAGTDLISEYRLTMPAKALASATYMLKNKGFISADVDVVGYKGSRIKFSDDATYSSLINQTIRAQMRTALNARLGAEYRFGNTSVRVGAAQNGSPYAKKSPYRAAPVTVLSAGAGYRSTSFFVDFGVQYRVRKSTEYAYVYEQNGVLNSPVLLRSGNIAGLVTIGWKY